VDYIANAQRRPGSSCMATKWVTTPMRCAAALGCAGRLGGGLTASGCARWLTGVGLTATFAVDLALVRAARRGGAFSAAFFLIILVFLTVFLRLAVLVTVVFLRFALAPVFVAMAASLSRKRSWPTAKLKIFRNAAAESVRFSPLRELLQRI
jgi:hypothetical protein